MATYLDVTVSRIQTYLVRYPILKSITNGSANLSAATASKTIMRLIAKKADPNPAAGEVDGKISLILRNGVPPEDLARDIVASLTRRLPAARFQATWGNGASYVEAKAGEMLQRSVDGRGLVTLPPLAEFPPARLCQRCQLDHAAAQLKTHDDETEWSCPDCAERVPDVDESRTLPEHRQWLLDALELRRFAADFGELAALGTDDKRNHLATVYADGNGLGRFFKTLADDDSVEPGTLDGISRAVAEATRTALAEATTEVQTNDEIVAIAPHVVGGDDVVVSVPASLGWAFTRRYLKAFREALETDAKRFGVVKTPQASAAIVFAHKSFPFSRSFEAAAAVLTRAKEASRGGESTIGWLDVTDDGELPLPDRTPWALEQLETQEDVLTSLAAVPASARATVSRFITTKPPAVAAAAIRNLRRRLDVKTLDTFEIPSVQTILQGADAEPCLTAFRASLDTVRWWS